MIIRKYKKEDCSILAKLFYNTVHSINAKDYSKEQLEAWTGNTIDLEKWNSEFSKNYTVIAVIDDVIVGFGDIDKTGYLDKLYVHKDYQRMHVAKSICDSLEMIEKIEQITTYASITAKGFFEKRGYKVIKKQEVKRNEILLTNYVMKKYKKKQ